MQPKNSENSDSTQEHEESAQDQHNNNNEIKHTDVKKAHTQGILNIPGLPVTVSPDNPINKKAQVAKIINDKGFKATSTKGKFKVMDCNETLEHDKSIPKRHQFDKLV
jgi:hypothetical protein